MSKDLSILLTTCHKLERHLDAFVSLFDLFWEDHPPITVVSDVGRFDYKNKFIGKEKEFAPLLLEALAALSKNSLNRYCYLVLEDLAPIWKIDCDRLKNVSKIAINNDLAKVNFSIQKPTEFGSDELEIEGQKFYTIKRTETFHWPNSLQPALWRVDFLKETCERAMEKHRNPWQFEHLDLTEPVYASSLQWPTVFHGLSYMNKINRNSLPFLRKGAPYVRKVVA